MKRLLTRSAFETVLAAEGKRIDVEDPYQVFAVIWDKFWCEQCGKEELYRSAQEKFVKANWVREAASKAKGDGWHVPTWSSEGNMDLVAYCANCKEAHSPEQRA